VSSFLGFSLEEMLPDGKGLVVMLKAYFDASERANGLYCVAGFAFESGQAPQFAREWRLMLGTRRIWHTKDLVQSQGEFEGLTRDERDALFRKAVSIVRERACLGVIVACNLNEIKPLLPRDVYGFGKPYPFCCNFCLAAVGKWLNDHNRKDRVSYLFEQGDGGQGDADALMHSVRRSRATAKLFHYHSHGFAPKEKRSAVALQAADLLAWEYGKFKDETVGKSIRPARGSFRALILGGKVPYLTAYLKPPKVAEYVKTLKRFGGNVASE
jgi:hypothetical protein